MCLIHFLLISKLFRKKITVDSWKDVLKESKGRWHVAIKTFGIFAIAEKPWLYTLPFNWFPVTISCSIQAHFPSKTPTTTGELLFQKNILMLLSSDIAQNRVRNSDNEWKVGSVT